MPTYQYTCTDCGEQVEVVQKFTDDALTVCPACGGRLRKVFSPVGIVFKGSGFYRTDSRKSSADGTGKKEPAEAKSSDSSNGSKDSGSAGSGSGSSGSDSSSSGSGSGSSDSSGSAGSSSGASGSSGSSSGSGDKKSSKSSAPAA